MWTNQTIGDRGRQSDGSYPRNLLESNSLHLKSNLPKRLHLYMRLLQLSSLSIIHLTVPVSHEKNNLASCCCCKSQYLKNLYLHLPLYPMWKLRSLGIHFGKQQSRSNCSALQVVSRTHSHCTSPGRSTPTTSQMLWPKGPHGHTVRHTHQSPSHSSACLCSVSSRSCPSYPDWLQS